MSGQLTVCIVGAGPRGVSVLERICANARQSAPGTPITVHVVDPHRPGAGQVWRTWQSGHLLMNTVASQVTLFTDDSVDIAGPVTPGPSLYEWARCVTPMGHATERYPAETLEEARNLGPDDYPTRAFYGHYLEWVFRRVVRTAPDQVSVVVHQARAVSLDGNDGAPQTVMLEDGTTLSDVDAVVLAQGHVGAAPTATESQLDTFATARGLTYVLPANPADVDLSAVRAGEPVLLRGLGLNFFDYMALLTVGRGGRFERDDGRLHYQPSGAEPRIYAGSRRGVPHHSRGENEKGPHGRHDPQLLTPAVITHLRQLAERNGGLDFRGDLWPLVAAEVEAVYYTTLLQSRGCQCTAARFRSQFLASPPEARSRLLDEFGIDREARWDWNLVARPHGGRMFTGPGEFRSWLLDRLRSDVDQARAGNVRGPVKAALDVLRDLRNEIRLVVDHGGLTGSSHRDHLDRWYTPLNAFLSIGPPARRIEEMIALIEAGVLDILGPDLRVETDEAALVAHSPAVPGSTVRAAALIEARLPEPDLRRTTDPLLRHLMATGQCHTYRIPDPGGEPHETGGLAVTDRPYHLVDAGGRPHPRRFAYGVPTESVHWVTAAGVRPGVNSVTLGDSDAIARAALALAAQRGEDAVMSRAAA